MSITDETIDQAILSVASGEWVKTALLISKVFETEALSGAEIKGQVIAERLYILVDGGKIEVKGNMRRWRDSEVKLAG